MPQDIYQLVKQEETNFTMPIPVVEGYEWNFPEHVKTTVLYKNSQFKSGKDENKPYKNIILPILRLQYRSEGFDVKDIELFVNSSDEYYKSFLVKKFHEKWARENNIDTFIDELVESYVDFGAALVKDVNDVRPEVVPLQSIAFCDQTDMLSGPFAIRHFFSPDQLKDMEKQGWGDVKKGATVTINEVINAADNEKRIDPSRGEQAKTPGKYIEVYEVHGMFKNSWLTDKPEDNAEDRDGYTRQLHIITFKSGDDKQKSGATLFRGKESELPFKLILRDKIYGRALGLGGAEELFEPQVWTNYSQIRQKEMLDAASKVLFKTTDQTFATKNKTRDLDNGDILVHEAGTDINQLDTTPRSIGLFEKSVADWEAHAQQLGSANDSIMGDSPTAGTPFKLQELVTQESHSLHEYRRSKLAVFVAEIYRDWILPYIVSEITRGQKFLSELSVDELQYVADAIVNREAYTLQIEKIFNGEIITEQQVDEYKTKVRDEFVKTGTKRFFEIFKDEMKDAALDVEVNIAGKQKDLAGRTDKLTNIMRFAFSTYNPQTSTFAAFDDPRMAKILNDVLESSGLDPVDFYQKPKPPQQPMMQEQQPSPVQQQPQNLPIV